MQPLVCKNECSPKFVTFSKFVAFLATKYFVTFITTGPRAPNITLESRLEPKPQPREGGTLDSRREEVLNRGPTTDVDA